MRYKNIAILCMFFLSGCAATSSSSDWFAEALRESDIHTTTPNAIKGLSGEKHHF